MSKTERLVQFELLGQEFTFYTAESEEDMDRIFSLVRGTVKCDSQTAQGSLSVAKTAVLGCLTMASRYVKLENEFERYRRDSTGRIAQISDEITKCLEQKLKDDL